MISLIWLFCCFTKWCCFVTVVSLFVFIYASSTTVAALFDLCWNIDGKLWSVWNKNGKRRTEMFWDHCNWIVSIERLILLFTDRYFEFSECQWIAGVNKHVSPTFIFISFHQAETTNSETTNSKNTYLCFQNKPLPTTNPTPILSQ